ncbi:4'-phosphopantetheinyl transferase [Gymnopilus junonius]|uniref:4'-phosphopantetheinyl transferase n=1 Tax=Gymnopilus junonius TaxID=109634 RepID=A0A9P5P2W0_GYMJU|nr:4'-phosphopantetheinyl transferase [Gymnopilus junonius]
MAILGIGVDLVHIPRIAAILARGKSERFACRILSKDEYLQWQSSGFPSQTQRAQFLAVRWSVKEAAFKAMYPVVRPSWKEVTYYGISNGGQKPYITYQPGVPVNAERIGKMHVSVSHDGDYVYSSVIVEEPVE